MSGNPGEKEEVVDNTCRPSWIRNYNNHLGFYSTNFLNGNCDGSNVIGDPGKSIEITISGKAQLTLDGYKYLITTELHTNSTTSLMVLSIEALK